MSDESFMLIRWVSKGPLDDSSIKEWTNSILLCRPKTSPDTNQAVETRHNLQSHDPRGCRAQPHPTAFRSFRCLVKRPKWSRNQQEITPRLSPSQCSARYDLYKELQADMSENREERARKEGTGASASRCAWILWPPHIISLWFFFFFFYDHSRVKEW